MGNISAAETRSAVRDLRLKVKLENTFRPEIRSLFNRMLKDFFSTVAAGTFFQSTEYRSDWEFVIRKQIDRTQRAFRGVVEDSQKSFALFGYKQITPGLEVFLSRTLLEWKKERVVFSANKITQTNQRMYEEAVQDARDFLIAEGTEVTNQALATTAARIARRRSLGRVTGIAMSETQAAAEATKIFEAQALSGLEPSLTSLIGQGNLTKTTKAWATMGDGVVRHPPKSKFNHVAANGQVKNLNEPYIVSSERLMQPGDRSLGASIGNVFNCRCSSQYRIAVA